MENIFQDVFVIPSYGKKEAVIKWVVAEYFLSGYFIIQKSNDGVTNWNTIGEGYGLTEFVDKDFIVPNKTLETFYRVNLQFNKKRYVSNSIATFEKLNRREYGLLHRMMQLEQYRMNNASNGISVIIFKQKTGGKVCSCVDEDSLQSVGSSMCPNCYGNSYEGGFEEGLQTFVEILQIEKNIIVNEQGQGQQDTTELALRIVAYPELIKGDMIVNPRTDTRYLVEKVQTMQFKGIVPFVYAVSVSVLRKNDIRYKFPLE